MVWASCPERTRVPSEQLKETRESEEPVTRSMSMVTHLVRMQTLSGIREFPGFIHLFRKMKKRTIRVANRALKKERG
jgi:hypothetical protein